MMVFSNPIIKSALMELLGKRFVLAGAETDPPLIVNGEPRETLRLTFVEAPDQFVAVPLDRLDEVDFEPPMTCLRCHGTGVTQGFDRKLSKCIACDGTGHVNVKTKK